MKKICILLSLMFILFCSGCGPTKKPLLEGTYTSDKFTFHNEDMKDKFSQAKVTIKEITKEEYEKASGVNVFIDGYTSQIEEKRYLSIELYLYATETEQYELVTLFDFDYIENTQQVFHSKSYLKIDDNEYQGDKINSNTICYIHFNDDGLLYITLFDIYISEFINF